MSKVSDIALAALNKLREKEGASAAFPSDKIWTYATEKPDSTLRPGAINWLRTNGYIEATQRMTNAATEARAGSKTPEYRFGPQFKGGGAGGAATAGINRIVASFQSACEGHLRISSDVTTRFTASLLSKRFLILTGLAGSGKTKLAQAFARWITPLDSECVTVVPVGADWTGNENILGYPDGLRPPKFRSDGSVEEPGVYLSKPALALIQCALTPGNEQTPHFLILDEMNLSHVERYFADILSAIESGEPIPLHEDAARKAGGREVQRQLSLPDNLFIIGTVNVDETTYMFSPKVLDRANVIEFRLEAGEVTTFLKNPVKPRLELLVGKGESFGIAFVESATDADAVTPAAVKVEYENEMLLFFNVLREHNAEFGYRVAHEAARFLHFYQQLGGFGPEDKSWFNAAMDAIIIQKLLPKLHGSRSKLEGLLWALAWASGTERINQDGKDFDAQLREASQAEDEGKYGPERVWTALKVKNAADPAKAARYPLSYDKVMRMWRKLIRDQFVNFAEA